jgi:hypothetical protein
MGIFVDVCLVTSLPSMLLIILLQLNVFHLNGLVHRVWLKYAADLIPHVVLCDRLWYSCTAFFHRLFSFFIVFFKDLFLILFFFLLTSFTISLRNYAAHFYGHLAKRPL